MLDHDSPLVQPSAAPEAPEALPEPLPRLGEARHQRVFLFRGLQFGLREFRIVCAPGCERRAMIQFKVTRVARLGASSTRIMSGNERPRDFVSATGFSCW